MELQITGKHLDVKPEHRELAEKIAARLDEDYDKLSSLRLVLSAEQKEKVTVVANLAGKHINLNASCTAEKFAQAIPGCYDKLDKQMRRYLERIQDRSVQADPALKEKIWKSAALKATDDSDTDIFE